MIKEFSEAMRSMREYENSVLNSYLAQRNQIKNELIESLPDTDGEEVETETAEDYLLKTLADNLPNFLNKKQPMQENKTFPQENKGGGAEMNIREAIKKSIPDEVKNQIKIGKLSLKDVMPSSMAEIKRRGLNLSEFDVEAIYKEIQAEK
jgi:uncharacterized protein YajQ (UPF0234 family)